MKKITLLLLLLFAAALSTWSQSTFTILPKFQVGDTLVYEVTSTDSRTMEDAVPSVSLDSRKFYLIVKEEDNEGNLKVDYLMKETKLGQKSEVIKDIPHIEEVEKFFCEDILKTPIHLTIDRAGRLLSVDNKNEVTEIYLRRLLPAFLEIVKKELDHKLTAKEKEEAKETLKAETDIMDMFDEIPALFKYYGQPLMEGKSETVDSVTTKYAVARMDDGTTWLKTNIDLMNGDEAAEEDNPGEEFLEGSDAENEEDIHDEGFELGITAIQEEEYKYNKEGIATYLKFSVSLGNKDVSELNSTFQSETEVKLTEIKKKRQV